MKIYIFDKKKFEKAIYRCALIMIVLVFVVVGSKSAIGVFSLPIRNMVVIIDAGHGGIDPGAIGRSGTVEDEINLGIALKLRRLIEAGGGTALMIREDDSGLYTEGSPRVRDKKNEDLRKRHDLINTCDANIFVSIHLNSFPQSQYYGAQTFYNKGDAKGKALAELIQNEFITTIDRGNKRVAKCIDNVYILRNNNIPGALVECGFLSNSEEERLLTNEHYQEKAAWCIFTGIIKYFQKEKEAENVYKNN